MRPAKSGKLGWPPGFRLSLQSGVKNNTEEPTKRLEMKAVLNRVQRWDGFVCRSVAMVEDEEGRAAPSIHVRFSAREGSRPKCPRCQRRCPGYDQLPPRCWAFVPLWGLAVWLVCAPRRVRCPEHGVHVESLPWSDGKSPVSIPMMLFLATWARRLSWGEVARVFRTSWESVERSVRWVVDWGLRHRRLDGVRSIGIDDVHWGKGKAGGNFLTVIYQIDEGSRRLLWVGRRRTEKTLRAGLDALGAGVVSGLRHVCSDMWRPYLKVVAERAGQALHVLDRFHVAMHLNAAVDEVRRGEVSRLRGKPMARRLKRMRWRLLRRGSRVRGKAREKLRRLVASKMATGRAWALKEGFQDFWKYRSVTWARGFMKAWCGRAMRSRLEPMKRVARMLVAHEGLLMNWFRARGELSSGPVEGLNNKIRVVTRRSYGFRTYEAMELALYHNLGRLPEPEVTHKFC